MSARHIASKPETANEFTAAPKTAKLFKKGRSQESPLAQRVPL
jgi:hypothetical protein